MPEITHDKSGYPALAGPVEFSSAVEITPASTSITSVNDQTGTDEQLIELWLHGRSQHTQRGYKSDAKGFLKFVGRSLHSVSLADLQAFADDLETKELRPASRHRILSATKSLFAFAHRLGYLQFDVAKPLRLPGFRDGLSGRILSESDVQRMLALERHPRNSVILLLLYASGVRVSELSNLRWSDCQQRQDGGQVTVLGKGAKTRVVLLPQGVWTKLIGLGGESSEDRHVFVSRRGGRIHESQILRIVKKAAVRAGVTRAVSPHWLRHAHASHALDHGAPIHLVQSTLGHADLSTTGRYLHARPADGSARYLPL
jgi:integrase/recombinase XerD